MGIKDKIKQFLPQDIVNYRHDLYYSEQMKALKKNVKAIEAREKKAQINMVFVIQQPETWNSLKSVFEAAEKSDEVQPLIWCVPKKLPDLSVNSETVIKNEAYEYFSSFGEKVINAYDAQKQEWKELESYKPDYVFYARPYNAELPEIYMSKSVSRYAKVCLIPYGYTLLEDTIVEEIAYNRDFLFSTYKVFVPNESTLKMCQRKFVAVRKQKKFLYMGYPRFDMIGQETEPFPWKMEREKTKLRIAWTPRWVDVNETANRGSNYLNYIDCFIEFMKENPDVELVIRPHPLMFDRYIEAGIMKEDEVKGLKENIKMSNNISFDPNKDYMPLFASADILISDFTSLLIEFFVTKKPIIYCDNADSFNEEARSMDAVLYHAGSWKDIERIIKKIEKNEDNIEERNKVLEKLQLIKEGTIGTEILEYVIEDYMR